MSASLRHTDPGTRIRWRLAGYALLGAAGLIYAAVGTLDAALLTRPEWGFRLAEVDSGLQPAPWRPWAYVPTDAPAPPATRATQGEDPDLGSPVFGEEEAPVSLADNDLYQRVRKLRGNLDADAEGVEIAGVVSAPLRQLADWLGAEMQWDGVGPAVLFGSAGRLLLRADSVAAERGFDKVTLPRAPFVRSGEFYLPLTSAAALLDGQVVHQATEPLYLLTRGSERFRVLVTEDTWRIEIIRSARILKVYYGGAVAKTYGACIGEGENTPVGEFQIQNKAVAPGWRAYWGEYIPGGSPRNPLGVRWLGTTAHGRATGRVIGIHGTNQPSSIGQRISGGCVRLQNAHAIELYETIPIGTHVSIHE